MFSSPTVFVVGAGASAELGLPIGDDLKSTLTKMLQIKFDLRQQISGDRLLGETISRYSGAAGHNSNQLRKAGIVISEGLPIAVSIDNFLEAHADNSEIVTMGKLAICAAILESEKRSPLRRKLNNVLDLGSDSIQSTWFPLLAKQLMVGVPKSRVDSIFENVTFIIFNYDRCLETFLLDAVMRYYAIPRGVAEKVLATATFLHPYGVVGKLPWQAGGQQTLEFGEEPEASSLFEIASGIRTFSERIEDEQFLNRIHDVYSGANTVVYLGFSFGAQNMELLNISNSITPRRGRVRRAFGTVYQVSGSDSNVIAKQIRRSLNATAPDFQIELMNSTCAGLFSEYWRSMTT